MPLSSSSSSTTCQGCQTPFSTRAALFAHLTATQAACLNAEQRAGYELYLQQKQRYEKVAVLYGYYIDADDHNDYGHIDVGQMAAQRLLTAMDADPKSSVSRTLGHDHRQLVMLHADKASGATTEVLSCKVPELQDNVPTWLAKINGTLQKQHPDQLPILHVHVMGRLNVPGKFNAEMDYAHRRIEYVLPLELLHDCTQWPFYADFVATLQTLFDHGCEFLPSEPPPAGLTYLQRLKSLMQRFTCHIQVLDSNDAGAVLEKQHNQRKRQHSKRHHPPAARNSSRSSRTPPSSVSTPAPSRKKEEENGNAPVSNKKKNSKKNNNKGKNVLRRRRYHNFTATVMAHEFLALRRLDRFQHAATVTIPNNGRHRRHHHFLVLSCTGDLFLRGQVPRLVGVLVAVMLGRVPECIIDAILDETYPHLLPTPPAPWYGVVHADAFYLTWEGKCQAALSPRATSRYEHGWNDAATLHDMRQWTATTRTAAARWWIVTSGENVNEHLSACTHWLEQVLLPWAAQAQGQLDTYQRWKIGADSASRSVMAVVPSTLPVSQHEVVVPLLYRKVLRQLQTINNAGTWPMTTSKRQLVMVGTTTDSDTNANPLENGAFASNLSVAHHKAKANKNLDVSAYAFTQGQGGASGSFSIGAMPDHDGVKQPRHNQTFPELLRDAFALERLLVPQRAPSSTIAVNRNAQFRPHIDAGAGAGQSTSLIVGLGDYTGGELWVEGTAHNIRYRPLEFDGWTQRHWTSPFYGERYSLVWFTPKGCEGVHGINLTS